MLDGRLLPGPVLPEAKLSQIFGSSRSPVKQALEQLRAEGLVIRVEGCGLVVDDGAAPRRQAPLDPGLFAPHTDASGVEV